MSSTLHEHNWITKEWETVEIKSEDSGNLGNTSSRTIESSSVVTKIICLECGEEMAI